MQKMTYILHVSTDFDPTSSFFAALFFTKLEEDISKP